MIYEVLRPSQVPEADLLWWQSVIEHQPTFRSAFYTPAYLLAVEESGFPVSIVVARTPDGAPLGILPLQTYPGLGKVFGLGQRAGGAMCDYWAVVTDREADCPAGPFLAAAGLGVFQINHMPERKAGPGEILVPDEGSPQTLMPQGFDCWWTEFQAENKSRASDLMRRRRKLERDAGPIRFEFESTVLPERLGAIVTLKSQQYRETGALDIFAEERNLSLLTCLSQAADPTCQIVVSELFAGDTWAASHIGLRHKDVLHYWFPVYNEALKRTSPGRILIYEILAAMSEHKLCVLDYGLGESRTKMEFANHVVPLIKGQWTASGLRGLVARFYQKEVRRRRRHHSSPRS